LGLASTENRGHVPNPLDDQSLDQKRTNYNLAKVISGFGINCQNRDEISGASDESRTVPKSRHWQDGTTTILRMVGKTKPGWERGQGIAANNRIKIQIVPVVPILELIILQLFWAFMCV
jgi:hypothetical protein